jgi:hypothetical protein
MPLSNLRTTSAKPPSGTFTVFLCCPGYGKGADLSDTIVKLPEGYESALADSNQSNVVLRSWWQIRKRPFTGRF